MRGWWKYDLKITRPKSRLRFFIFPHKRTWWRKIKDLQLQKKNNNEEVEEEDVIMITDKDEEEDENCMNEEVIDISNDEEGWEICLPEVELMEPECEYWLWDGRMGWKNYKNYKPKIPMLAELIRLSNGNFHWKFFNGNFYEKCWVGDVPVHGKRTTRAGILIMSEPGRHHTLINFSFSVSIKWGLFMNVYKSWAVQTIESVDTRPSNRKHRSMVVRLE